MWKSRTCCGTWREHPRRLPRWAAAAVLAAALPPSTRGMSAGGCCRGSGDATTADGTPRKGRLWGRRRHRGLCRRWCRRRRGELLSMWEAHKRASLPLRRLWVVERRGGNDPLMVTLAIVGGGGATADSDGGARCCRQ